MKKIWSFFHSMQFAMLLLGLLTAACLAGSLIPQGNAAAWYLEAYPRGGAAILALRLDDVFHCLWFLVLACALCLNLILCNLTRFPALLRRMRDGFSIERCPADRGVLEGTRAQAEALFRQAGFLKIVETAREGRPALYAVKNRAGLWGAWLCHLGILVIVLGFGLGQRMQFETWVYGIPGQTLAVEGTAFAVTIDDFSILLREDETVDQYRTALTVTNGTTGERDSGVVLVNHPLRLFGLKFYQNSTGWGAYVSVAKDGTPLQDDFLCAGEYVPVAGKEQLRVLLRAFYPDYAVDGDGLPFTRSSALNNPAYLYMLYYGDELLGMNVLPEGEPITVDDYTILLHDPTPYTLLQIKRDPFEALAALGGLLILAALLLAFYLQPAELWAVEDGGLWRIGGRQRKNNAAFQDALARKGAALGLRERENHVSSD